MLSEAQQVLSIPSAALGDRDRDGRSSVRVVDSAGQAVPRSVKVGLNNNINAQILDGLAVGERVVVGEAPAAGAPDSGGRSPRMRPPSGM